MSGCVWTATFKFISWKRVINHVDYIKGFATHAVIQPDDVYTKHSHCPIHEVLQMHTLYSFGCGSNNHYSIYIWLLWPILNNRISNEQYSSHEKSLALLHVGLDRGWKQVYYISECIIWLLIVIRKCHIIAVKIAENILWHLAQGNSLLSVKKSDILFCTYIFGVLSILIIFDSQEQFKSGATAIIKHHMGICWCMFLWLFHPYYDLQAG